MADFGYEKLLVWQYGMDLAEAVYRLTQHFPREEIYGLTSQLRRSAVSVPANIAEGCGRGSRVSQAHFARVARGSLFELRTELQLAIRVGVTSADEAQPVLTKAVELSRMIEGFIRSQTRELPTANS